MPFSKPFNTPQADDFVYGLYNNSTTMVWLEKMGCKRMGTQFVSVNSAYDITYPNDKSSGNRLIVRQSKVGLNLFTQKQSVVHFVLDGINMDQVPSKSYQDVKTGDMETKDHRSITGAELRWVYRHRDDGAVQQYIQFWYKRKQCTPPWETSCPVYSSNWASYIPSQAKLTEDVSSVGIYLGVVPVNNDSKCCCVLV